LRNCFLTKRKSLRIPLATYKKKAKNRKKYSMTTKITTLQSLHPAFPTGHLNLERAHLMPINNKTNKPCKA
jgi:hypothetical protein